MLKVLTQPTLPLVRYSGGARHEFRLHISVPEAYDAIVAVYEWLVERSLCQT
jgi:hypothetical protein